MASFDPLKLKKALEDDLRQAFAKLSAELKAELKAELTTKLREVIGDDDVVSSFVEEIMSELSEMSEISQNIPSINFEATPRKLGAISTACGVPLTRTQSELILRALNKVQDVVKETLEGVISHMNC